MVLLIFFSSWAFDKFRGIIRRSNTKVFVKGDEKKKSLERLKKQLKGNLNRLAESNMRSIATQIESMYSHNSRNDMNETLFALITDAIISPVLTPERLGK